MFTSLSCTFLNSTDTMPSPYSGDGFSFCISSTSIFAISANICHWSTDNLDITEIRRCLKSGSPLSRSPKNAESSSFRLLCKNIGSAPFFNQSSFTLNSRQIRSTNSGFGSTLLSSIFVIAPRVTPSLLPNSSCEIPSAKRTALIRSFT